MLRVARGELPETVGSRDRPRGGLRQARRARSGYGDAVRAAAEEGFGAVLRLAGGRAAIFHEGTLRWPRGAVRRSAGGHPRALRGEATLMRRALGRLGVHARVGGVGGEYCPGRWSVNAGGARKLVGIGQRVVAGGSHTGSVIVVEDSDRVERVLGPVYAALSLAWNPETVGAVEDEAPGIRWAGMRDAVLAEYAARYDLVPGTLDGRPSMGPRVGAGETPPGAEGLRAWRRCALGGLEHRIHDRGQTSRGRSWPLRGSESGAPGLARAVGQAYAQGVSGSPAVNNGVENADRALPLGAVAGGRIARADGRCTRRGGRDRRPRRPPGGNALVDGEALGRYPEPPRSARRTRRSRGARWVTGSRPVFGPARRSPWGT